MRERRHKLIKYVKMFVGNQMAYSLYMSLRKVNVGLHIFKFKTLRIEGKIFVLFYIDDFIRLIKDEAYMLFSINDYFRLIKVENICPADIKTFSKRYDNIVEKNGYQIIYSVGIDWNIYGKNIVILNSLFVRMILYLQ